MPHFIEKDGEDHISLHFRHDNGDVDYLGSFKKDGYWIQNDGIIDWVMDIVDCREVIRISDRIQAEGFDKVYAEAQDPVDDESEYN